MNYGNQYQANAYSNYGFDPNAINSSQSPFNQQAMASANFRAGSPYQPPQSPAQQGSPYAYTNMPRPASAMSNQSYVSQAPAYYPQPSQSPVHQHQDLQQQAVQQLINNGSPYANQMGWNPDPSRNHPRQMSGNFAAVNAGSPGMHNSPMNPNSALPPRPPSVARSDAAYASPALPHTALPNRMQQQTPVSQAQQPYGYPLQNFTPQQQEQLRQQYRQSGQSMPQNNAAMYSQAQSQNPAFAQSPHPSQSPSKRNMTLPGQMPANIAPSAQLPAESVLPELRNFLQHQNIQLNAMPVVEGRPIDLVLLYRLVQQYGGVHAVTAKPFMWDSIISNLGFQPSVPGAGMNGSPGHPQERTHSIMQYYRAYLLNFEQYVRQRLALQAAQAQHSQNTQQSSSQAPSNQQSPPAQTRTPFQQPTNNGSPAFPLIQPPQTSNAANDSSINQTAQPQRSNQQAPAQAARPPSRPTFASQSIFSQAAAPSPSVKPQAVHSPANPDAQSRSPVSSKVAPPRANGVLAEVKKEVKPVEIEEEDDDDGSAALYIQGLVKSVNDSLPSPVKDEPVASTSKSATDAKEKGRRKQKIVYRPTKRKMDTFGGLNPVQVEEAHRYVEAKKRKRTVNDLGTLDTYALNLSLQSGLPSEVVFALNALSCVSESCRTPEQPNGLKFQLSDCGQVLDTMLDMMEELAFPPEVDISANGKATRTRSEPQTYRELSLLALADTKLRRLKKRPEPVLPPRKILLSILCILRNFAASLDNNATIYRHQKFVPLLVRLTSTSTRPRLADLNWADVLTIKKDVLVLLAGVSVDMNLELLSPASVTDLWQFLSFFLSERHEYDDPLQANSGNNMTISVGHIGVYADLALSIFTKLGAVDQNRNVLSANLPKADILVSIYDTLLELLPSGGDDLLMLATPFGNLGAMLERTAMGLFLLAFLASSRTKEKLRTKTQLAVATHRMITVMLSIKQIESNVKLINCSRLLETLLLLYEESEVKAVAHDEPFFGTIEEGVKDEDREKGNGTRTSVFEDYVSLHTSQAYDALCMRQLPPGLGVLLFRLCAK